MIAMTYYGHEIGPDPDPDPPDQPPVHDIWYVVALVALLIAAAALLGLGCEAKPLRHSVSANPSVTVSVLTEFDGIRVYRLQDGSDRTVYIAASLDQLRAEWQTQITTTDADNHTHTTTYDHESIMLLGSNR